MKTLTLWQPWASLMAFQHKRIETRCWKTKYRGPLAIHSAASLPPNWLGSSKDGAAFQDEYKEAMNVKGLVVQHIKQLPRGAVLCIVNLVAIEETQDVREGLPYREQMFGNYEDGRYAWLTELVEVFDKPVPAKGNRLLWEWQK